MDTCIKLIKNVLEEFLILYRFKKKIQFINSIKYSLNKNLQVNYGFIFLKIFMISIILFHCVEVNIYETINENLNLIENKTLSKNTNDNTTKDQRKRNQKLVHN